jgi:Polysaccharide lyase family 8, super-sandwich domain
VESGQDMYRLPSLWAEGDRQPPSVARWESARRAASFWPTVDAYRLPGTTVDKRPLPHRPDGSYPLAKRAAWTGGAVLNGQFAAVGMDLEVTDDVADGLAVADAVRIGPAGATPCSVVMREHAGELMVAVAEPTHESPSISITLDRPGYKSWTAAENITVHEIGNRIRFSVDTRDAAGVAHTVTSRRK